MSATRNAIAAVLVNSANYPALVGPHILGRDLAGLIDKVTEAVNGPWKPGNWSQLTADTEQGDPVGDTIRLSWEDGTVLVGRLTVPSVGAGHHQVLRMQTVFGGDTYVFAHGATLEVLA